MIWIILIVIVGFILISFLINLNKDNIELSSQPIEDKLEVMIKILNNFAFDGNGKVIKLDKRSFNLYENGKNQIINFNYSTGHLFITWKYKYFLQEVVLEKQFANVRFLSSSAQENIAMALIEEMESKVDVWTDVL
jgi:hypothetical protein